MVRAEGENASAGRRHPKEPERCDRRGAERGFVNKPHLESGPHDFGRDVRRDEFPSDGFDLGNVLLAQTAKREEERVAIGSPFEVGFSNNDHQSLVSSL